MEESPVSVSIWCVFMHIIIDLSGYRCSQYGAGPERYFLQAMHEQQIVRGIFTLVGVSIYLPRIVEFRKSYYIPNITRNGDIGNVELIGCYPYILRNFSSRWFIGRLYYQIAGVFLKNCNEIISGSYFLFDWIPYRHSRFTMGKYRGFRFAHISEGIYLSIYVVVLHDIIIYKSQGT